MSASASPTRARATLSAARVSSAAITAMVWPRRTVSFSDTVNVAIVPPTSVPIVTSAPGYVTTRPSATTRGFAAGLSTRAAGGFGRVAFTCTTVAARMRMARMG
jgi:hypothetical protein